MRAEQWGAIALGLFALWALSRPRRSQEGTVPSSVPPGERPPLPSPQPSPPAGFSRYRGRVTPAMTEQARNALRLELGQGIGFDDAEAGRMFALVEWHYDDHAGGGLRWHKGVSLFVEVKA